MTETPPERGGAGGEAGRSGSGSSRRRHRGGRGRGQGQGQAKRPAAPVRSSASGRGGGSGKRAAPGARTRRGERPFAEGTAGQERHGRRRSPAPAARTVAFSPPTAEPLVRDEDVRANRRRAQLLAASGALVPAVVVGAVLGAAVSAPVGAVAFVVLLVVGTLLVQRLALPGALRVVGARPAAENEFPHLRNLIEGLCPTFGVRAPRLMVLDDPVPNACALASGRDHGTLVVTPGVEAGLDLIEMEGVIAHELSHLKRGDAVVSAVAVAVLAPLSWAGGDQLLHRVLGRGREFRADQVAVRAVRYPPGLHDALVRFSERTVEVGSFFAGRRFARSRWIWVDPSAGDPGRREIGDLDLTAVRIDALAEL